MSGSNYTSTLTTGITLSAGGSVAPMTTPKALIATRAVETKDGWRGQIIVAEDIVWESATGSETASDAEQDATYRVIERIKSLLTAPHDSDATFLVEEPSED